MDLNIVWPLANIVISALLMDDRKGIDETAEDDWVEDIALNVSVLGPMNDLP